MTYWLNVHHPPELDKHGRSQRTRSPAVWLKDQHRSTYRNCIKSDDIAVVYEIDRGYRAPVQKDGGIAYLDKGKKGIVAVVKIKGQFVGEEETFDNDHYIGYFPTCRIETRREFVPLNELQSAYLNEPLREGKTFSPRINGGLRKLKPIEWEVISRLLEWPMS